MILAAASLTLWLQTVPDPAWSKFKPGTWVKYRGTSTRDGKKEAPEETRRELVALTSTAAVVTTECAGEKVKEGYSQTNERDPAEKEIGNEDLVVDGKTFKCRIVERKTPFGKGEDVTTMWICEDAPEPRVKTKTKNPMVEQVQTLVKVRDVVKVAGREFTCWVVESESKFDGVTSKSKFWKSRDVPSLLVRSETKTSEGLEGVNELVEFEFK